MSTSRAHHLTATQNHISLSANTFHILTHISREKRQQNLMPWRNHKASGHVGIPFFTLWPSLHFWALLTKAWHSDPCSNTLLTKHLQEIHSNKSDALWPNKRKSYQTFPRFCLWWIISLTTDHRAARESLEQITFSVKASRSPKMENQGFLWWFFSVRRWFISRHR